MIRSILPLLLVVGCDQRLAPEDRSGLEGDLRRWSIVEGSAEALGMLAFLHDPLTTESLLDLDVGLDVRAARSLVAGRPFDTVAEADAQYYVGPAALTLVHDWALAHGYVALHPEDVLGTWDGVTFTVAQAEAVLHGVNTAADAVLDHDLGLDSRAVASISEARPVASIAQLAGLYYVGGSALGKLVDAFADPVSSPEQRFADDLSLWLEGYYARYGADLAAMGGASLSEAVAAVSVDQISLLDDPDEDPYGHDLDTTRVYTHPDVTFPGSDRALFGAYDAGSGDLLEIWIFH